MAAQNSYLKTVETGKETVYKAPCDVDPKPAPAPKSAPAGKAPPTAEIDAERARRVAGL